MFKLLSRLTGDKRGQPQAARKKDETPEREPISRKMLIAEIESVGETAVATLTVTELTQEQGADRLADLLDELRQLDIRHIVLDIQNVQFMDSACLGTLVEALNRMSGDGGRIALVNPAQSVSYVFKLTRLDRVFPICPNVMAAIEAVERGGSRRSA